jgi:hypothetical protein
MVVRWSQISEPEGKNTIPSNRGGAGRGTPTPPDRAYFNKYANFYIDGDVAGLNFSTWPNHEF